jgi:hypothetical protein
MLCCIISHSRDTLGGSGHSWLPLVRRTKSWSSFPPPPSLPPTFMACLRAICYFFLAPCLFCLVLEKGERFMRSEEKPEYLLSTWDCPPRLPTGTYNEEKIPLFIR